MPLPQLDLAQRAQLSASQLPLQVPPADIAEFPERVLQFGTGVLLRGLPDFFIDKANRSGHFRGRIVQVKSTAAGKGDAFSTQDGLYTLVVRGVENGQVVEETIVNSAIARTLSAKSQWDQVLATATQPDLDIVISNTTEVGIQLSDDDVKLSPPESFPGKLCAWLYARWKHFAGADDKGVIIIPTELVVDNGTKLKDILDQLAEANNLEITFRIWVANACTFCNSLVDRIVPGYPEAEKAESLFAQLGYRDELLAMTEVYRLWAIEGDEAVASKLSFAAADPGCIVAPDIFPFRERKLRLLNGTHTISVALGYLYGLNTVGECMNDALMGSFIKRVALEEIVPAVKVDETSAKTFAKEVLDRFRNPHIVHPLINITLQYSSKMKMRNVQSLKNYAERFEKAPTLFSLGFAAYLLFMKPEKKDGDKYFGLRNGELYPINDDNAARLAEHWAEYGAELPKLVTSVLRDRSLWEADLSLVADFENQVTELLLALVHEGVRPTLAKTLALT